MNGRIKALYRGGFALFLIFSVLIAAVLIALVPHKE